MRTWKKSVACAHAVILSDLTDGHYQNDITLHKYALNPRHASSTNVSVFPLFSIGKLLISFLVPSYCYIMPDYQNSLGNPVTGYIRHITVIVCAHTPVWFCM